VASASVASALLAVALALELAFALVASALSVAQVLPLAFLTTDHLESLSTTAMARRSILLPILALVALYQMASLVFVGNPQVTVGRDVGMKSLTTDYSTAKLGGGLHVPGGGDGSWREGKKGSFGTDAGPVEDFKPRFSSGQMTLERQKFFGDKGQGEVFKAAKPSAGPGQFVPLLLAGFVFWSISAYIQQ